MKEEDIRPNYLIRENAKLHFQDVSQLLKNKEEFEEISCPACESSSYQIVFEKNSFTFVKCRKCETMFINPRPTLDMLVNFYKTSKSIKHWNKKIFPASESFRRKEIFTPRAKKVLNYVKKYNISTKILLDVGAGFGTFCEEVKKLAAFNRVIALEPSPDLAETCRSKGLETIEKPIEEVDLKGIDVITNFELIEHLYRPKDFLLHCRELLSTRGILITTTPNIKGFDLLLLGKLSDNIGGPNHLNYFHPESLKKLLEQCGFKVVHIETPGKLDAEIVRNKVLKGEFNISTHPFLKLILIEQWDILGNKFQQFLTENLLSSHLWIVAKKI